MGLGGPLPEVLDDSRDLGLLGPGPVEDHVRHAGGFVVLSEEAAGGPPARVVDIGAGGGIPGLVLAAAWPQCRVVLVEAAERRAAFLRDAVDRLGFGDRVRVLEMRAEQAARAADLRGLADVVTARSFGPPAVTAECAVGFLRLGGAIVVSDPPDGAGERWPTSGLDILGLTASSRRTDRGNFTVLTLSVPLPDRYPRRVGIPAKRPLF